MKMARFLLAMAVCAMILEVSLAATYIVGGPKGSWDESTDLEAWVKSKKLVAGDKLVFMYAKSHDVVEVPKSDYDTCGTSNAIISDNSGKSVVPLTKPGIRYFICGVPGHCSRGMKMEVKVFPSSVLNASLPAMPPATIMPGSPLATPSESPLSLAPVQNSSAGRGIDFRLFVAFIISSLAVYALLQ